MAWSLNAQKTTSNAKSLVLAVSPKESPAKMTPQREKKTPKDVDPGHPA
ncbi:hypothetical protein [Bradyrhizobium genomosp. I (2014)]|nr:hypothetical protein [Bradyrhizobium sp. CCBAU 43298]